MGYSLPLLVAVITLLLHVTDTQGHFLSIEDLEEFHELEEKLEKTFTTFVEEQKQILEVVTQRYENQKRWQPKINDTDEYLGNPLNVHAMLKRLALDWPLTLTLLGVSIADEEDELINLPNIHDYHAAVHSIARLQQVYGYSTEEIVNGSAFLGTDSTSLLTAEDCLAVGKDLYINRHYQLAIGWFKEALVQATNKSHGKIVATSANDQELTAPPVELIYEYLALATCFTGDQKQSKRYFKKLYNEFPEFRPTQELIQDHLLAVNDTCKRLLDNETLKPIDHKLLLSWQEDQELSNNYTNLCKVESIPAVSRTLGCTLLGQEDPYWRLHPFKMEYLHLDPDVYLTYDSVHRAEREFLMEHMIDENYQRTQTTGQAQEYWAALPANSSISQSVLRRADWISDAFVHNTREQVYVSTFPPGSEYVVDRDVSNQTDPADITRHGSVLFFLQQPGAGGLMAFPRLGLSVAPAAGAALVWINVNDEGRIDPRMVYGFCPVIRGHMTTTTARGRGAHGISPPGTLCSPSGGGGASLDQCKRRRQNRPQNGLWFLSSDTRAYDNSEHVV